MIVVPAVLTLTPDTHGRSKIVITSEELDGSFEIAEEQHPLLARAIRAAQRNREKPTMNTTPTPTSVTDTEVT